ncbi:phosphoribosylglycinamide formyltransferase [Candidatus Micrarchaeota archaeon]|nr:phosphoribosylglycinamide formyltransferase [Candidatus Micrarchaeota archaeon]MBU1165619.1 phosphoribosylglycinamide formyltransferase [Candidatus Micrarchaeota archaeon]MBU1886448.1 phosphoribosylglycinamide formyltransferase [Candidatus Micrarchaeota archaeon]
MSKLNVAILASGRGSNFQAILNEIKAGRCNAEVKVLITDNPEAKAIDIAKQNNISFEIVERKNFEKRSEMDDKIKEILDSYKTELVVLAGYMRIIKGKLLLESYKNRIINIHPSLLPLFPGENAQKQAFNSGAKVSGLTIHFVDETLDGGPIIYQEKVDISDCKSAEETADKILKHEHKAYAKVIDLFSRGSYIIEDHKAVFIKKT